MTDSETDEAGDAGGTHGGTSTPTWRRVASRAGAVVLGLVLLVASWAKALDPDAFAAEISSQGLDFLLPASWVAMIALLLEIFLGAALVLGVRKRWTLWPSAGLVVFFLFLTGRTWWRAAQGTLPEAAGCGCFGNLVQRTPAEAFWQDLLLMVPALLLAFLARSQGGAKIRLVVVSFVTAAGLVFAWQAPDLPLDDLATRLHPGAETASFCAGSPEDGAQTCMDAILPEIEEGEHLVILADLDDPAFVEALPRLEEYYWTEGVPRLWVLSSASEEELFQFRFRHPAPFEIRETPEPILKPLYRTLPRSFRVDGGTVTETWSGVPPLDDLGEAEPGASSSAS